MELFRGGRTTTPRLTAFRQTLQELWLILWYGVYYKCSECFFVSRSNDEWGYYGDGHISCPACERYYDDLSQASQGALTWTVRLPKLGELHVRGSAENPNGVLEK